MKSISLRNLSYRPAFEKDNRLDDRAETHSHLYHRPAFRKWVEQLNDYKLRGSEEYWSLSLNAGEVWSDNIWTESHYWKNLSNIGSDVVCVLNKNK